MSDHSLSFVEDLAAQFTPYGALSKEQLQHLEEHYLLLTRWNQKMNLTRMESQEEAVRLHYCESLYLATSLPPETMRIADVGSGAGFPGIPVAVFRPDCSIDLIESNQRKAVFLRQASSHLKNVTVVADRAEACRGVYDWMIARAIRPDQVLACGLASNASILMSVEDAVDLKGVSDVRKLPWGVHRGIVLFHVEHEEHEETGRGKI